MKRAQARTTVLMAFVLVVLLGGLGIAINAAAADKTPQELQQARDKVRDMANDTLQELYAKQPAARQVVEGAAGYAVFRNFGMKILVAGGGSGKGLAVDRNPHQEIFMRMAQIQAGLGFGIKRFRLVWVFQTQAAFNQFVDSGLEVGGQATLAAQASDQGVGYAGAVSVSPGVWLYQITDDGLAAELTIQGTKYFRDKDLNQSSP